jgi:LPS export ABC transporter protein LptC
MRLVNWLLWLGLIGVAGCADDSEITPIGSPNYKGIAADQILVAMEQFVTDAGRRKAVLRADTALVFEDSAKAHLKKVDMKLYDEAGAEAAQLTSREGEFNNSTQAMVARGKVVLVTRGENARTIETEELHYDPNTKRVWSTKATTMRSKDGTVNGTGFEADDRFENVRVTNARSTGGGIKIQF